ncbi:MAG: 4Fe-4S dicluster domain-containing protein [Desulfurococcaceae archaeon]
MLYVGSKEDISRLFHYIKELTPPSSIIGYKVQEGSVVFGALERPEELVLGLPPRIPQFSPKYILLPPEHVLVHVNRDYAVTTKHQVAGSIVLFGIKPCDLLAMRILDYILMARHPIYTSTRGSLKLIVAEECLRPLETCFCGDVKAGPLIEDHCDIAYAIVGDTVFFKALSGAGLGILRDLRLSTPGEKELEKYMEASRIATERASGKIPVPLALRKELVDKTARVDLWRDVSRKCLACGSCNYVCPTCFCIELEDMLQGDGEAARVAKWIGCRTYTYGLVAGGHFRRELYTRYRHFVLHKFVFYEKQVGRTGCVGCGRCTTWCPAGIDLKESLREVSRWK